MTVPQPGSEHTPRSLGYGRSLQALIDAEAAERIGAEPHQRMNRAGHIGKKARVIIFGLVFLAIGLVLLAIGYVVGIRVLVTIGGRLVVIGVILWVRGSMGRAVDGRMHYY